MRRGMYESCRATDADGLARRAESAIRFCSVASWDARSSRSVGK